MYPQQLRTHACFLSLSDANQFKTHFESAQKANAGSSADTAPSTEGGKVEDAVAEEKKAEDKETKTEATGDKKEEAAPKTE